MARVKLAEDVTLADVVGTLNKPTDYVRGVLGSMAEYQREHGPSIVRIGTTGEGRQPNYRIEPVGTQSPDFNVSFDDIVKLAAFNGSSHKRTWEFGEVRGDHWSHGHSTFEQVQSLLGELRGFKRKST